MHYPRRTDVNTLQIRKDGMRGRDQQPYIANDELVDAANVALSLGLPLLLTGEPGCGKTDFAFVMANALADLDLDHPTPRLPHRCHIRSDSRARDLLYHYDALLRFTDGHHGNDRARRRAQDARHYIELRGLGIALTARARHVVLIDEIDKAPRDLPNDLLRELDNNEFEIAEIPATAGKPPSGDVADHPDVDDSGDVHDEADAPPAVVRDRAAGVPPQRVLERPRDASGQRLPPPVMIITSNVERQLPDAFLRRCVFYHIPFPDHDRLTEIIKGPLPRQR